MTQPSDLQKLLRLKRHEQPPENSAENFLREFQKRQRTELLQCSVWQLALERLQLFVSETGYSRLAYGAATAALLIVAGVSSFNILRDTGHLVGQQAMAVPAAVAPTSRFALDSRGDTPLLTPAQTDHVASSGAARPHYVMDARPVSYEPPASF